MRISALILLAAAVLGSGAAAAADLFVDDPEAIAAAADYDWSGAYAGVFGGAAGSDVSLEPEGLADPLDLAAGGWLAGIRAGVNAEAGVLVFGAEADLAKTWISGNGTATQGLNSLDYSYDLDWLGTVTGRVGFAADTLLLYAKGGLAAGGVRSTLTPTAPLPAPPPASADAVATGWTVGLGTEFAFSENATAGIEYDFVSLGTQFDYAGDGSADAQQDLHIVKLGVNYGF